MEVIQNLRQSKKQSVLLALFVLVAISASVFLLFDNKTVEADWLSDSGGGSWLYRRPIIFNNSTVDEDLTDFPALVTLTDATFDYGKSTGSAGADIRFTDSDGTTELKYEIESWNENGTSTVWVKVPTINANDSNDHIYAYYGNSSASDNQDAANVWDSNFTMVQHLQEGDSTATDFYDGSTSNDNDGTLTDADGDSGIGEPKVNGNFDFNGDADSIGFGDFDLADGENTISFWVKRPTAGVDDDVFAKWNSPSDGDWNLRYRSDEDLHFWYQASGGGAHQFQTATTLTAGEWVHVTFVYDWGTGGSAKWYLDGVDDSSASWTSGDGSGSFANSATTATLGAGKQGTANWFAGSIDELRVSNSARSAAWVRADYLSQSGSYNTFGMEEVRPVDWYDDDFAYRNKLTINNASSTEALTDFPVLVTLTSDRINYSDTQNAGQDIRFTNTDGLELDYEIETWDETATSTVWVRIPSITALSTGEYVYMYYGNPNASDNQNAQGVWDSNFTMVQHMQEDPSTTCASTNEYCDSTSNDNDGDANGSMTADDLVTGKVGSATDFEGTDDSVDFPDQVIPLGAKTIEAWFNTADSNNFTILDNNNVSNSTHGTFMWMNSSGNVFFGSGEADGSFRFNLSTAGSYNDSTWYYAVGTWDGTTASNKAQLYIDGAVDSQGDASNPESADATHNLFIGPANTAGFPDGLIDEVRISGVERSAEWVEATYITHTDNMLTYGAKEFSPAPVAEWKFDEGVGSTAYDNTSNNVDGYFSDWLYRRTLTFDNSASAENLTDFPVLVSLGPANVDYAKFKSDGTDVRFVDNNGTTTLSHEIESWDTNGTSTVWVRVPQIDSGSTTDYITLYYGNSEAPDASDPESVWDENYKMVQHLQEGDSTATGFYVDSTGNDNDGQLTDSDGDSVTGTGQINGAYDLNGDADSIVAATSASLKPGTGDFSIGAWIKTSTTDKYLYEVRTDDSNRLLLKSGNTTAPTLAGKTSNVNRVSVTGTTDLHDDEWHYLVAVVDRDSTANTRFYLDGADDTSGTPTVDSGVYDFNFTGSAYIGSHSAINSYFNGLVDEFRYSTYARSADWIEANYLSQKESSTFITYGNETTNGTRWTQGKFGNAIELHGDSLFADRIVADGGDPWWNESYDYRMKLAFDNSASAENLTDFPTLVQLLPSNFPYSNASSTGADVRFVDKNGTTTLAHEINTWSDNATSTIWVKVPQIDSNSVSDYMWIYWGNDNVMTSGEDAINLWDDSFAGVWHLDEDGNTTANGYDDSAGGNDGTGVAIDVTDDVDARIDKGQNLDGAAEYIDVDDIGIVEGSSFSISAWIKTNISSSAGTIYGDGSTSNAKHYTRFQVNGTTGLLGFDIRTGDGGNEDEIDSTIAVNDDVLHHVVAVRDSGTMRLYIDGAADSTGAVDVTPSTNESTIGAHRNASTAQYFADIIDELKVSTIARSADWIEAEYLNQKLASTFITYSNPSTQMGTSDWSINAWVKTGTSTASALVDNRDFTSKDGYALIMNSDGTVSGVLGTGSGWATASSVLTVNDNSWHFISATYDRDDDLIIYIDGKASGSATDISSHSTVDADVYIQLVLGNVADPLATENAFDGFLDEVQLYRYARAPDQILVDYNDSKTFTGATTLGGAPSDWMSVDWSERKKLTIDNASSTEDLIDFPLHVQLTTSNFTYSEANATGTDIRFTDSDGITPLPYEIESWDSSATTTIWVKVPRIDATSQTDNIYMYWGNTRASDGQDAAGVWDSDYAGVWHIDNTAGLGTDSTSNSENLTNAGVSDVGGQLGQAGQFVRASNDDLTIADNATFSLGNESFTMSQWLYLDSEAGNEYGFAKQDDYRMFYGSTNDRFGFLVTGSGTLEADTFGAVATDEWHYVTVWHDADSDEIGIDVNGGSRDTVAHASGITDNASNFYIGSYDGSNHSWDGRIDETRFTKGVVRSAEWIEASYRSQKTGSDFITHGSSESIDTDLRNGWALDGWHNRTKLIINNASSTETLTDFPIPIKLTSSRINYSNTQDSGQDIRILDSSGDPLDYEIETWDETATSTLWVRIPSLPANSTDEYIWLYYGNSDAKRSTQDPEGVWDANYQVVQHLSEAVNTSSNGYVDSTRNDTDGTGVSMALTAPVGQIGVAQDFDGSADYIQMDSNVANVSSLTTGTIEAWFNPDDLAGTAQAIMTASDKGDGSSELRFYTSGSDLIYAIREGGGSVITVAAGGLSGGNGVWYHGSVSVSATADADGHKTVL